MKQKWITSLIMITLAILMAFIFIYAQSISSLAQAQSEAEELINYDYTINKVQDFSWVTTDESYFYMYFTDSEGVNRYAIITQEGGDITYFADDEIISKEEAVNITLDNKDVQQIRQAKLAFLNNQPTWEVIFKDNNNLLSYYYIDATDGEWVQTIANL